MSVFPMILQTYLLDNLIGNVALEDATFFYLAPGKNDNNQIKLQQKIQKYFLEFAYVLYLICNRSRFRYCWNHDFRL